MKDVDITHVQNCFTVVLIIAKQLPFLSCPIASVPESFGKGIVVDFQLSYLTEEKKKRMFSRHFPSPQMCLSPLKNTAIVICYTFVVLFLFKQNCGQSDYRGM